MNEIEYKARKQRANEQFKKYREGGGVMFGLDWLWENDPALLQEIWSRRRSMSSYPVTGGVMFSPAPQKRRGRR